MFAQPRSPRQPPAYLLPRGSPACQRKRVRCAGSSTTSARAGESDSRDVRARAKARRYEDSGDDGSKGNRFLAEDSEGVQDVMDAELVAGDVRGEDARRLARNGAVVLIRADDYPDPWIEIAKDSRCAEIEAYRCAGDDDDTPLRGKTGGFLMRKSFPEQGGDRRSRSPQRLSDRAIPRVVVGPCRIPRATPAGMKLPSPDNLFRRQRKLQKSEHNLLVSTVVQAVCFILCNALCFCAKKLTIMTSILLSHNT